MQNPRLTRSQSDPQAGPVVDDGATETDVVENGKISYSAVFLDDESQQKIMEFCRRTLDGGIPERWKRHCDHMTICVGSLSNPKTEDFRSVADTMQKHISRYQDGQKFELNVVSVGHNEDVIAVGVIGCVSCNRNPHVTVATAPFVAPNASNFISKWRMLEATEQFKVTGQLRQHRSGSHGQGAAPAPAAVAQPSQEDAAAEVKDGFVSHFWHEKRFKLGLVKGETGNECPDGSWFGTGTKKMFGGEEPEWPGMALMLGFSKEDATTFVFQETGKTKGGETVNPRTLPETGGVTVASVPVYSFRAVCGTWVTAIDDGPGPEYYMLSSEPTNHFAFLPLEPNSRWPLASGVPPPDGDCSYGMYSMEKKGTGEFAYWMDGDYPVYIIENQLCCASDECEPPTRYKVSLMAEKHRVIQVDIDCGGASMISVTCQSVAGETLARFELPSYATLGDLRHQANKVLQPPEEITLSLLNLRSGQVLSPSEDAERLTKL